jgi:hypothetical protein
MATASAPVIRFARSGDVDVAHQVVELVDRGIHELKGVPGEWRLFAVA